MGQGFTEIKNIIDIFSEQLKTNNITIQQLYLFGSYCNGTARDDSDIDLAIVSESFSGIRIDDRSMILPIRRKVDLRIDPFPFHPSDFNEFDPLAIEIIRNGVKII
jgi:uncharacterized protein